jgi:hypothetical protein
MFLFCITNHIRCKTYHILKSCILYAKFMIGSLWICQYFQLGPLLPCLISVCVMKFVWGSFCILFFLFIFWHKFQATCMSTSKTYVTIHYIKTVVQRFD